MVACPDDNAMAGYVDGTLPPEDVSRIDTHLTGCATCRQDLSALAAALTAPAANAPQDTARGGPRPNDDRGRGECGEGADALVPGDRVGRYVLSERQTRGGMGIVSVAYDPELGRNVAIKVLQPTLSAELLRDEARAMAKLGHPNVVSVYDVGEDAGRIYFAMELVEGVTLRRWLAHGRRGWRAALHACIEAGRGLAAAHREGLVHRDFKPDNVLCGPGDRVRVTDFGLAATSAGGHEGELAQGSGVAGTPAYMAPEVWMGLPATARSDQWAFAATVYEALFGTPPFVGANVEEIRTAILRGELAMPRTVPTRVRRALGRGLAKDPEGRYPTLEELLADLERSERRTRVVWIGVLALVACGATVFGLVRAGVDEPDPCEMSAALFDEAWNPARADAIGPAFAASERKHAPESARRVRETLDRYRTRWLGARREACIATRVRGDQSEALLDARVRCLDRRRVEVGELARVLGDRPPAKVVDRAVQVASEELDRLGTCSASGVQSEEALPRDPGRAKQILGIEREVATLRASLTLVTNTQAATAKAKALVERARSLEYAPAEARAAVALARLGEYSTDHTTTEKYLYDALVATAKARDDRATAEIWTYLVMFTANTKGDPAGALRLLKPAEAALARVESPNALRAQLHHAQGIALTVSGDFAGARAALEQARGEVADPIQRATIDAVQCHVEQRLGKSAEAQALCARAAATYEREVGPDHPSYGLALGALALLAFEQYDHATARPAFEKALAILENTVGKRHVAYAMALNNIAMLEARENHIDLARRQYTEAIALFAELDHPERMSALANLGDLERRVGNTQAARAQYERALAIATATYGETGDRVASLHNSLGAAAYDAEDFPAAERHYGHALEIASKHLGAQHPVTALALDGLGYVHEHRGDCRRARGFQARAIAAYEASYGPNHPAVADTLTALGRCQAALGERAALASFERALVIRAALPSDDDYQAAATRWSFAQALWKLRGDRARARELAREARALYARTPDEREKQAVLREIDGWLAARR